MTKKLTTIYLDIEQLERLNKLSSMTKTTKSVYIREAFDLVLKKYENELKKKPQKIERKQIVKNEKEERRGFFRVLTNLKGQYILKDKKNRLENVLSLIYTTKVLVWNFIHQKRLKWAHPLRLIFLLPIHQNQLLLRLKEKLSG